MNTKKKKKKPFLSDNTPHDLKYIQDMNNEFTYYISQLILNVYNGITSNLGIKNPDMLTSRSPQDMTIAKGFLKGMSTIGRKIRGYIGRKLRASPFSPFEIKGMKLYRKNVPLTNKEWTHFENQIINYLQPYISSLSEEMAVKNVMLAMVTNELEERGKAVDQYGKKSYEQIEQTYYSGYVPDTFISAEERYQINSDVKVAMAQSFNRVGEYMSNISDDLVKSVKDQTARSFRLGESPVELASNLYWQKDDVPEVKNQTAEIRMRDWQRVAHTEIAMIHERGKLAQYESIARKSIDNPEKALYFVFQGSGRCDWCNPRQGAIVRLIPLNAVGNERDDSLSSRGIDDPYTNVAIWQGKNNIGYKKSEWRLCVPVHPLCGDTFSRIYPAIQEYDKETGRIKYKVDKELEKFVPTSFVDEIESEKAKYRERQDILAKKRAQSLLREEK